MPPELRVGTKLLGHLIDFDPDTPETQVMLERTENALHLTLAWNNHRSAYARWFSAMTLGGIYDEDDDAPLALPTQLLFQYTGGTLFLLGCEIETTRIQLWGSGSGTIRVKYAISNVWNATALEKVNGLRSEITGLRRWLGISSINQTYAGHGNHQMTYVVAEPPPIEVGGPNALRLAPTWRAEPDDVEDTITLRDRAISETTSLRAQRWDDLLTEHRALRDLLVLSAWRSEEIRVEGAYLLELAAMTEHGVSANEGSWYAVPFAMPEGRRESSRPGAAHLIRFDDLGREGILRWLELRKAFARAIDPVVSSRISEQPSIQVHLSLAGMGMEALGYLIALEEGRTVKQASDIRFANRLRAVGAPLSRILPFVLEDWVTGTTAAYNGLKHANREPVSPEEAVLRQRQTILVFRVWTAHRMGIPLSVLAERLREDVTS